MKKRYENQKTNGPKPAQNVRALFGIVTRGTCGSALPSQLEAAVPKQRVQVRIHVQMLPDFALDKNPVIVNISDASGI